MNNNPKHREAGITGGIATKQKWDKIKEEYLKTNPSKCLNCKTTLLYKHRNNKFCSKSCSVSVSNKERFISNEQKRKTSNTLILNKIDKYLNTPNKCKVCNLILDYENRNDKICSSNCYNTLVHENKNKISSYTISDKVISYRIYVKETNRKKYENDIKHCTVCSRILPYELRHNKACSDECKKIKRKEVSRIGGLIGGKVSAKVQSENRRSKNEKLFAEKCINHFNKVLVNEPMFNGWDADVIIDDIKVAVLWNGKWHYEKITEKHSVKQVQNRDKIKIKEIKKLGYTPYVIKDMGKFSKEKVEMEFNKFLKWACSSVVRAENS